MSFQAHHGLRRGSTRAVTAPSLPPAAKPSPAVPAPQPQATAVLRVATRATAPSPKRNAPLAPSPVRPRLPPRGTLLDQLAQCQASTDALINDINSTFKSRYDRTGLLLVLPARHLHVGRCGSQFAGTARFFDGLVTYAFEHPHHRHVEMQMRYEDMLRPRLGPTIESPPTCGAPRCSAPTCADARLPRRLAVSGAGGVELQFRSAPCPSRRPGLGRSLQR